MCRPASIPCFLRAELFLQNLSQHLRWVVGSMTWPRVLEMQFYMALILGAGVLLRLGALRALAVLVGAAWAWRCDTIFFPGEAIANMQFVYAQQLPGTPDAFWMGIAMSLAGYKGQAYVAKRSQPGWANFVMLLAATAVVHWLTVVMFMPIARSWVLAATAPTGASKLRHAFGIYQRERPCWSS